MNEIQDVKDAFGNYGWEQRVSANPRRIYAFLLASDEHSGFLGYIQNAWRILHMLSGDACDIFTFEQWVMPHERFSDRNDLSIPTPALGGARLIATDQLPAIERKMSGDVDADPTANRTLPARQSAAILISRTTTRTQRALDRPNAGHSEWCH